MDRSQNLQSPGWVPPLAVILLLAFSFSCTREVARPAIESRQIAIDWERIEAQRLEWEGLEIKGVVMTPAQWPLESSVKRLLEGDFFGVIEKFNLSFRPSSLRSDVLQRLYDEGYLPAYVRVINRGGEPRFLIPHRLVVRADDDIVLYAVPAADVPDRFEEFDWVRTGVTVVVAALVVGMAVAANENRIPQKSAATVAEVAIILEEQHQAGQETDLLAKGDKGAAPAEEQDQGILQAGQMQPGEIREGFVFFRIDRTGIDWSSVRLDLP